MTGNRGSKNSDDGKSSKEASSAGSDATSATPAKTARKATSKNKKNETAAKTVTPASKTKSRQTGSDIGDKTPTIAADDSANEPTKTPVASTTTTTTTTVGEPVPRDTAPLEETDVSVGQELSQSVEDYEREERARQLTDHFVGTQAGKHLVTSIGALNCFQKVAEVNGKRGLLNLKGAQNATPDIERMTQIQNGFTNKWSGNSFSVFNTDGMIVYMCDVQSLGDGSGDEYVSKCIENENWHKVKNIFQLNYFTIVAVKKKWPTVKNLFT